MAGRSRGRKGQSPLEVALKRLKQLFRQKGKSPEDPYAYVMAPKKPKPPHLRESVAEREPD